MIRPKAILLISIVIFMDLLISSKMTKLPLVYEIYINIGTKVKKKEKGNQILTSIPKIGIEAAVSLLRNRMQPVDFYFNSRRNILFVKLRLVSTRIRDHPHLPQILSVEAQNLSPGPNVFYMSVTTRITFMHRPFVDTLRLFSLFRGDPATPREFVRSVVSRLGFIFYARTQWLARHIEQQDLEHYVAAYFLFYFASLKDGGCSVRHWWILILNVESGCTVSLAFMESNSSY